MTLDPGMYKKNGQIYRVKWNRDKTGTYAEKLVFNEHGNNFDYEYAKGAVFYLSETDMMGLDGAKPLMLLSQKCLYCGKKLEVSKSLERGIGPICIKYFRGMKRHD